MVFLHGWPCLGLMWRAQMETFAEEGWHCVAPDLRGYGRSSRPARNDTYTVREIVRDMTEFHDHLGGQPAIWVGHDWGSCIASAVAAHEPGRGGAGVLTSQAYQPEGYSLNALISVVDRERYPTNQYPDGQWEGYRQYYTRFKSQVAALDRDPAASLASIFANRGSHAQVPGNLSLEYNRFREASPPDDNQSLWSKADYEVLLRTFLGNGFRAPCAWFLNDDANVSFARSALNAGRIAQPVLYINGAFDSAFSIAGNRQGDAMRDACIDLTIVDLPGGHWLPLELATDYTQAIRTWLSRNQLTVTR